MQFDINYDIMGAEAFNVLQSLGSD